MNRQWPPPIVTAILLAAIVFSARVQADPAPADSPEKAKARALLKEGVRLLDAGQLAPALHKFEDAYAAFPSAKILVNIGTAQSGLGRSTDAANTYQRYLDSGNDDPVQLPAVRVALAELDAKLGRLAVKIRGPAGAASEVRMTNGPWMPLSASGLVRVAPGRFDLQARTTAGSREVSASGTIAAREHKEIVVDLTPPEPQAHAATPESTPRAPAMPPSSTSRTAETPTSTPRTAATPESTPHAAVTPESARAASSRAAAAAARVSVGLPPARDSRWTPLRQGAVAAGAVGVVGLTAMSLLALRARSMWNDARPDNNLDLARRAATHANLATGAGVIGVSALGTGIVLWFMGAPRGREPATLTAIVDGGHVGLAVMGPF